MHKGIFLTSLIIIELLWHTWTRVLELNLVFSSNVKSIEVWYCLLVGLDIGLFVVKLQHEVFTVVICYLFSFLQNLLWHILVDYIKSWLLASSSNKSWFKFLLFNSVGIIVQEFISGTKNSLNICATKFSGTYARL